MGGKYRFDDSFWETDFNSVVGFEILCKRIRDGQKTARDVEDFFKKKSKAQRDFSKALRLLAKGIDGKEETGVLGVSWFELKKQTEETAKYHEDAAAEYVKMADDISKFTDDLKSEAKQTEEKVKEKHKGKRSAHAKLIELQKSYQEKCREMINQENQLETAKQSVTMNQKEVDKLKVRAEKSKESVDKADTNYRQAVETLEQVRKYWEIDTVDACRVYQKQEEKRRYKLRDMLWRCTNIDSKICVDWDMSCETVRTCLEKCSIDDDIQEFIINNRTGGNRPVPIQYESYFDNRSNRNQSSPRLPKKPTTAPPPIPGTENMYSVPYDGSRLNPFARNTAL